MSSNLQAFKSGMKTILFKMRHYFVAFDGHLRYYFVVLDVICKYFFNYI